MKVVRVCSLVIMLMGLCLLFGCKKKEEGSLEINEPSLTSQTQGIQEASVSPMESENPTVSPESTTVTTNKTQTTKTSNTEVLEARNASNYTIVIDAGHQRYPMDDKEPIAPGATQTKAKVSPGTKGSFSGIPEYEVTLDVSLLLRDILKNKGYNVVMVRESHDVTISNSERAIVANNNNADAFIRIHCNYAESQSAKGALTMCQTKNNQYCGQYYSQSRSLSDKVIKRLCEATGASSRGVMETDTMSGINWCNVPVTIVEMGFMSNREEDLLLVDKDYQNKLAIGIAKGVIEYLNEH